MKYTLKQWRTLKGMSQTELADAVGVTYVTMNRWENGKGKSPRYVDLVKLSTVLETGGIDNIIMPYDLT